MIIELLNKDHSKKLLDFIREVDSDFPPPLSQRNPLDYYVNTILEGSGFGVIKDKKIIAAAGATLEDNQANIMFVGVSKSHRGRGLGKSLICELIKELKEKEIKRITIRTWPENKAALSLYRRLGFQEFDYKKDICGPGSDRIYLEFNC